MTLSDRDFQRLSSFVQSRFGINLSGKRSLIESRLAYDISRRGFESFGPYIDLVTGCPQGGECQHMINRLSTNYSFFFRDTGYISHLKGKALPQLLREGRRRVELWSAGCAGGQEAYSVAMVLSSMAAAGGFDFHITGTDINTEVLETAERGSYPAGELKSIPEAYRRYVRGPENGRIEMAEELRAHISWERENLMDMSLAAPAYDIVFCRNVLIYFAPETRKQIADKLYLAIRPGGYLYTGAMEAMEFKSRRFVYIAPSIYRKGAPQ